MKSDLKYKEVLDLQYDELALDKFVTFIESVPFPIFIEPIYKIIKEENNKKVITKGGWNPIIYETLKISKKDFEDYENKHKLKIILDTTAIIKGKGNWLDGMRILKDECMK